MYRQGTYANLADDFVVLCFPGREFDDLPARLRQFKDIGLRHQPVGPFSVKSWHHLIYDSKEKVGKVLKDLALADLALSVTVSGLRDQVVECCHAAGLTPHTVCQSLGFWGRTERLPHSSILEITTMCGHGRVSPGLVWDLANKARQQGLGINEASRTMGKLCACGIFNESRAAKLMKKLIVDLGSGVISLPQPPEKACILPKKDYGIIIDRTRCVGCKECIPYCPVSAIAECSGTSGVGIDPERCTECGVCLQAEICPVGAIAARELTWPRTLRGRYHNRHAPYRAASPLAQISHPLSYTEEGQIFPGNPVTTGLTNDVRGFYRRGDAGIMVELGQPHLGTTFRDVQKAIQALAPLGLRLDMSTPLADIIADVSKGTLIQEILDETTGWVVLGLVVRENLVSEVVRRLRQVEAEADTVFAVSIVSLVETNGSAVADRVASQIGLQPAINCKTNVGLGRPLAIL